MQKVHYILENFYKNAPDGLIGNEDCGQMSAWYVLSSIGLYKVTPGSTFWETVTPYFENIKIHVENGKTINIKNEQNIINWISETVVPADLITK